MKHRHAILLILSFIFLPIFLVFGLCVSFFARCYFNFNKHKPRLVWGATPIISNVYWSRAMKNLGYESTTYTKSFYSRINQREDWDLIVNEKFSFFSSVYIKYILAFFESLFKYDIFFMSFDGFFLGNTPYWWLEGIFLKIAMKKIVVLPYGGDSYVYRRIRSISWIHGLMMSYPVAAKRQIYISFKLDYWCCLADVVVPGIMGPDGFGRWDVLTPCQFSIDLNQWHPSCRDSYANAVDQEVVIAHAPNHRGCKGTEFIINVIEKLKNEGFKIKLLLIENKQNSEVKSLMEKEVDILIEQLIVTGHGFNAIEGMASSLPVICNLEDESILDPYRRWSFFSECPIVSANPETLLNVLRSLITNPALRSQLGKNGRKYVEKYHGLDSAQFLFSSIIDYLYGRIDYSHLINIYNPLTSPHSSRLPRISSNLNKNRIN